MLIDAPYQSPNTTKVQMPTAAPIEQVLAAPAVRAVQRLTLIIFWLLIMEGALRKWVAPQYSNVLFFIRDPFVLLVYWYALRGGLFKAPDPFLSIGLIFAAVAPLLALAQVVSIGDNRIVTVMIYGWRQYFLYLPLPFVIARTMDERTLWRFARHVFLAVILSAPLIFAQFHSAGDAVVNRGSSEDEALQFKSFALVGDYIRPSGFFTSAVGNGNLVAAGLALLLGAWLMPARRRNVGVATLAVTAAAAAACLAQSGSRGAFANSALVGLSCLGAAFLVPDAGTRARALVIPSILFVAGAMCYPILFPDAFAAMTERVVSSDTFGLASGDYGIFGRAAGETFGFMDLVGQAPLAGYALGLGGNGRTFLGDAANQLLQGAYAESDWTRHIVDLGPVIGMLFILYRVALVVYVFRLTIKAATSARDPLPFLLFGYIGIGVFYGQLTGHGTVGGFLWLFLGVTLASYRNAMNRGTKELPD